MLHAASHGVSPVPRSRVPAPQVFEQLFQLYEQKLPKRAERDFRNNMFVDPQKHEYMCAPGQQLSILPASQHTCPQ